MYVEWLIQRYLMVYVMMGQAICCHAINYGNIINIHAYYSSLTHG